MLGHPTSSPLVVETAKSNPIGTEEAISTSAEVEGLEPEFSLFFQQDSAADRLIDFSFDTGGLDSADGLKTAASHNTVYLLLANSPDASEFVSLDFDDAIGSQVEVVHSNPDRTVEATVLPQLNANGTNSDLVATTSQSILTAPDSSIASIAQQAVHALKSEFASFQQAPSQSITIEISPPELGLINIQVEVSSDQISAQIIATEWVSAELLSRQKEVLVNSLSEF